MNKIEELIQQYCPNGVEFKRLWEVTAWDKKFNGLDKYMQKKVIIYPYVLANKFKELELEKGNVRLLSTGNYIGWTTEELAGKHLCEGEIVAIPWGGKANVKYCKGKFVTADNRIATSLDTNVLMNKFLYYWMLINNDLIESFYRGSGIKHPSMKSVLTMEIPIPPLPIQQEIVTILDSFTQLEAELEAELEARRTQYKYYRNQLLSFEGQEVEWKTLGEIGEFIRGNGLQKKDFTESGVGCIHYGQIYTYYGLSTLKTKSFVSPEFAKKLKKAKKGDLIIATTSENVEDVCKTVVWLGDEEICISGETYIFKHNQNPKYLAYYLLTPMFFDYKKQNITGTKVIRLHDDKLEKFKIPIPPISEQERIAGILDKFDSLVNDLSVGLPAEIAARRKQYEYYRGKLLSFEVRGNK